MSRLVKKDISFMKYRYLFFGLSVALTGFAIFLLVTRGLNYGTDFEGGVKLLYQFKSPMTESQLTEILEKTNVRGIVVQRFGSEASNTFSVKSEKPDGIEMGFSKPFNEALDKALGIGEYSLIKDEFVGPKVGKELRTKGLYAVIWAWIIMLVYIGFRFDFYFGVSAIIALAHDLLVAVGAFALTGREVNLTVLAAFLTIIGYSINDTIIVFDRIRENIGRHKGQDLIKVVDISINETLMRTIITSLTVFFVVGVLYFRAEGDIQNFAFAMIFGVITGTYSSVFVASPVFIFLKKHVHRFSIGRQSASPAK